MGGVMVDSGPFIAAERAGLSPRRTLDVLHAAAATQDLFVSAIAYTELIHGVYRADSLTRARLRLQHLHAIFSVLPVTPYDRAIAELAGEVRAQEEKLGNTLPVADSFIAASALFFQQPLLTQNLRDFVRIPGLSVIPFRLP